MEIIALPIFALLSYLLALQSQRAIFIRGNVYNMPLDMKSGMVKAVLLFLVVGLIYFEWSV